MCVIVLELFEFFALVVIVTKESVVTVVLRERKVERKVLLVTAHQHIEATDQPLVTAIITVGMKVTRPLPAQLLPRQVTAIGDLRNHQVQPLLLLPVTVITNVDKWLFNFLSSLHFQTTVSSVCLS